LILLLEYKYSGLKIPRGTPRGIFNRKEFYLILIRSLTPQQAAVNALAIAVQGLHFFFSMMFHITFIIY